MVRTLGPVATTSAQVSRLLTWAVAGIRMPDRLRRSPSDAGTWTRTRSLSILIGCLSWSAAIAPDRTRRTRSCPRSTGGTDGEPGAGEDGLGIGDGVLAEME